MKSNFLLALATSAMIFASCGETKTETPVAVVPSTPLTGEASLSIDPTTSNVKWSGEMLGLYSHDGAISVKEGTVKLKDGKVVSGNFTIDMNSIAHLDANYTEEKGHTKGDLIGHLSSPDFFDVANNPTATFAVTGVEGNKISGNLTVRGKTNPETVEVTGIDLDGENVKINGTLKFNRQNYGVAFAMPVKDKVLSDDINLAFSLVGKKQG